MRSPHSPPRAADGLPAEDAWNPSQGTERRAAGVASPLDLDSVPEVLMSITGAHILLYTPEPELLLDEPRHLIAIEAGGGSDGP